MERGGGVRNRKLDSDHTRTASHLQSAEDARVLHALMSSQLAEATTEDVEVPEDLRGDDHRLLQEFLKMNGMKTLGLNPDLHHTWEQDSAVSRQHLDLTSLLHLTSAGET